MIIIRVCGFYLLIILKINKRGVLDFLLLKHEIRQITIDGLKDFDKNDFPSNKFVKLFNYLSICMETGTSEKTIFNRERPEGMGHERSPSDISLLSTSSNEDKAEIASEHACQYFISGILDLFHSIRFLTPEGKYGDKLAVYAHSSVQRKASKLTVRIDNLITKP